MSKPVETGQVGFIQPGGQHQGAQPGQPPNPPNMMGPGGWMATPQAGASGSNIPPGLEYLAQLDQVLVQQVVELLEGNFSL